LKKGSLSGKLSSTGSLLYAWVEDDEVSSSSSLGKSEDDSDKDDEDDDGYWY